MYILPYELKMKIVSFLDYPTTYSLMKICSKEPSLFHTQIYERIHPYLELFEPGDIRIVFLTNREYIEMKFRKYIFSICESLPDSKPWCIVCHKSMRKTFCLFRINKMHAVWIEYIKDGNFMYTSFYRKYVHIHINNEDEIIETPRLGPDRGSFNIREQSTNIILNEIKNIMS